MMTEHGLKIALHQFNRKHTSGIYVPTGHPGRDIPFTYEGTPVRIGEPVHHPFMLNSEPVQHPTNISQDDIQRWLAR